MTKTLEQLVGGLIKRYDVGLISTTHLSDKPLLDAFIGELRKAYEEREKRLPEHILLENGLAKIDNRLEDVLARLPQIPLKVEVSKWATGNEDA